MRPQAVEIGSRSRQSLFLVGQNRQPGRAHPLGIGLRPRVCLGSPLQPHMHGHGHAGAGLSLPAKPQARKDAPALPSPLLCLGWASIGRSKWKNRVMLVTWRLAM
jgi:hypothetical protein